MSQPVDLTPQKMAKLNAQFIRDMQDICFKKCIPDYSTNDLNSGEKNCVDRCVFKYFEANEILTKHFHEDKLKGLQ